MAEAMVGSSKACDPRWQLPAQEGSREAATHLLPLDSPFLSLPNPRRGGQASSFPHSPQSGTAPGAPLCWIQRMESQSPALEGHNAKDKEPQHKCLKDTSLYSKSS